MHAEAPKAEAEDPTEQQGGMYFQKVEVRALSITADYLPRRLDIVAMRAGSKAEVCLCMCFSRPCGPDRREDGMQYTLPSRGAWGPVHLHVHVFSFLEAPLGLTGARVVHIAACQA